MVNADTLALLKEFEGLVLNAYPDPGSKNGIPWTIGYGHTKGVKKGDKITAAQAEEFLKADIAVAINVLRQYVKVPLNENQEGAMASFILNLGEGQFKKSSVLKYINAGRLAEVPGRMALYRMNDGKVMNGLVRRRSAEGNLWMKPVSTNVQTSDAKVAQEIKEAQGAKATPAIVKKPFDWGIAGVFITTTPCFVATGMSILSTPTPARPMARRTPAPASMTGAVIFTPERTMIPS